ncbi:hybrid sensor histidine kinase/response regulator [Shimia sp. MMG029]|uniref:hybrid sensor histidine kinase/response regulator n=1 Tax=Shimia sp. MMG029 TaxID=3021978 RepID=UPI0022FE67FC|nr:ATP-binding protein [Shimia sp. MMG029]MDA5558147.1 ATP-binding protein [Shimia sp. MMG029]
MRVFQANAPVERLSDRKIAHARRCRLLCEYVSDRVTQLRTRLFLYTFGCIVSAFAVTPTLAAIGFTLVVTGDLIDCFVLHRFACRWAKSGRLKKAQRLAGVTGSMQALTLVGGVALYFFGIGQDADVLFVFGALGIGAVNAAIALPKKPSVAIPRLFIYGCAPFVFIAIQAHQTGEIAPFLVGDAAGLILALCIGYVFVAFTMSGLDNFRIREDLEAQRSETQAVAARLETQQTELRRLSLVARNANDSVIFTDKQRRILWVNHAFVRVTGYSFAEAIGQHIGELLARDDPDQPKEHPIEAAVARGEGFRGDFENIRKDGRPIWVDVNLFPIHDDTGEVEFFISIERDVTDARKLAEDMLQAREAAEQGARAKAEFLANMSHEIRTPLTGVVGMADLLAETELDPEQQRYTETIRGSSMSLMAIINDILDLSKLDAGRMELHPVTFSPHACIKETLDLLSPSADDKGLSITLDVSEATPDYVKADDGRIRQILTNILGNAIKFTDVGGVDVTLCHEDTEDGQRLVWVIRDTGIGIPKEQQDQIFDHFTQAEAATTRKFGGTGLGLSITRHILDVMGGCISVQSDPGQGATFRIEIPYADAEASELAKLATASADAPEAIAPGLRVLVAEDNQTNRYLLKKFLKDQPIELAFAHDGLEAVEAVEGFAPDLIFMDMSMPRMNGVDATRAIRKMAIAQPTIVALTAHAFDGEMQACLDAGMDDFLTKPLRKATLLNWISNHQQNGFITGAA